MRRWHFDFDGLALVPVHKVGGNDECKHYAGQDDSKKGPTASLVIVCHKDDLPPENRRVVMGSDSVTRNSLSVESRAREKDLLAEMHKLPLWFTDNQAIDRQARASGDGGD